MNTKFDSRENNLDFVRLVLAIVVIFSHSSDIVTGNIPLEPMMRFSHWQTSSGGIAVGFFFAISGFLITNSFLRSRSLWTYLKKRVARIYPGFLVCMLFCALVVVPLSGARFTHNGFGYGALNFVLKLFALREFNYTHAFAGNPIHVINGSIWTISNEFYCYIWVAILGVAGLLRKRSLVLGMFLVSLVGHEAVLLMAKTSLSSAHAYGYLVGHLPLSTMFLAGMVFFLYRDKIPHKTSWAFASLCVLVISCKVPYAWNGSFALAGTYLLFWFGFNPNVRIHHTARFGDFSYGTYLYAFPIQELITQKLGSQANPFILFLIATPATLVAAILSWHAVERWFLSDGRKHGLDAPILAAPTAQHGSSDEDLELASSIALRLPEES